MTPRRINVAMMVFSAAVPLSGCGGGGGGSIAATIAQGSAGVVASSATPVAPPAPVCDPAVCGSVGAPAPASFGSNPAAPQLALQGGPTFAGAYSATFPLLFSGFQRTDTGLTAIPPGEGATITVTGSAPSGGQSPVTWEIRVPSANVDDSEWSVVGFYQSFGLGEIIEALSYVAMGNWETSPQWSYIGPSQSIGAFVFGYETPVTSMPASGQAMFTGEANAAVFQPAQIVYVSGRAALSVDFSSGKISGAFTGMAGSSVGYSEPWNDVSISAAIASGTNRFNGVTAVTSSPNGFATLKLSATGSINGAFYGPAAQQLGAIWTVTDGTTSVIGGVIAGH
ncbi:MAG TPA: transferrin-binding protein-like solute binding protein [Micropepsaceae bacterium]|nr:transferrin-binding protein-like solute binding protein [Micropepsaceae bacterium]